MFSQQHKECENSSQTHLTENKELDENNNAAIIREQFFVFFVFFFFFFVPLCDDFKLASFDAKFKSFSVFGEISIVFSSSFPSKRLDFFFPPLFRVDLLLYVLLLLLLLLIIITTWDEERIHTQNAR